MVSDILHSSNSIDCLFRFSEAKQTREKENERKKDEGCKR